MLLSLERMILLAYTKEDLIKDLDRLGIDRNGTLLVHSSYKSIGDVEGSGETVIDALMEYMKDGLLVFPTHTWREVDAENPRFYVESSPSCIGILPDLFRKREGVIRDYHPTHSVAAIGKDAEEFTSDSHLYDTPCSRKSPYGKLLDRKAQIMLLGVTHSSNTFIHGVEEWVDIPGRLTDSHEQLYSVLANGQEILVPSRRHCGPNWSLNFPKVDEVLEENGAVHRGKFGHAEVRVCYTESLTRILFGMLALNPNLFSDNSPLDMELYKTLLL